ncbi:hypothetical protein RF11_13303 [Thelohanellus kitauei]|uniref:Uncharacterized protein n=1 Tax=Thelohanellus kitauei TaxID=669202 RepID=A0A0C2N3Y7_THEKT|nr:hypothetical protein RF11_13303 [Thelohanellus kitauei]
MNFTSAKEETGRFQDMNKIADNPEIDFSSFFACLQLLHNQFENRFQQFIIIKPIADFDVNHCTFQKNVNEITEKNLSLFKLKQKTGCLKHFIFKMTLSQNPLYLMKTSGILFTKNNFHSLEGIHTK